MAARIGDAHSAPAYCRDNEYIKTGYRINFSTSKRIFSSLFMVHNESVNVWTHLLGVMLFLFLLWHSLLMLGYHPQTPELSQAFNQTRLQEWRDFLDEKIEISKVKFSEFEASALQYSHDFEQKVEDWYIELQTEAIEYSNSLKNDTYQKIQVLQGSLRNLSQSISESFGLENWEPVDRWPMVVFILSATFCLGCSVICHLFSAHSANVCSMVARLDYAGISILIAGSYYPVIFYIFYCQPMLIWTYLICITVFSVIVFILAMAPFFQQPQYRHVRGLSFLALGLLGLVPFSHMLVLPGIGHFSSAIAWFLMMGLCYVVGCCIYIIRIPERFFPGKFDLWGSSHNIWHCFVLAAVMCHYVGSRWSFYLRHEATCEAY
mmetsp:Transcript_26001/g.46012  ORF Transcript_26001/g.46012 Transcript_26001/m.46012 type:complete len:377 (-) Transcript_26001:6656-7786(-)